MMDQGQEKNQRSDRGRTRSNWQVLVGRKLGQNQTSAERSLTNLAPNASPGGKLELIKRSAASSGKVSISRRTTSWE
jgi:hypothetical protein